jgi:hypothetical protein
MEYAQDFTQVRIKKKQTQMSSYSKSVLDIFIILMLDIRASFSYLESSPSYRSENISLQL